ncbi:MAG: hypothetical protein Q9164_002724 [Protoblastenia rupestris]
MARQLSTVIATRNKQDYQRTEQIPAFHSALDAFQKLRKCEIELLNRSKNLEESLHDTKFRLHLLKEWNHVPGEVFEPACVRFLDSLSTVGARHIPPEDRNCPVCTQQYSSRASAFDETAARQLPCGHLVCAECLEKWFTPFTDEGQRHSCPHCRAVCFPKMASIDTLEGGQARLDAADWALQFRDVDVHADTLRMFIMVKINLFGYYVDGAAEEVKDALRNARTVCSLQRSEMNPKQRQDLQEVFIRQAVVRYLKLQHLLRSKPDGVNGPLGKEEHQRCILQTLATARSLGKPSTDDEDDGKETKDPRSHIAG